VAALTDAAEHVARTRDLSRRIEREGDDELSRLAGAFNTMLEALAESQRAQRRLVADASHELRTPLTSLRTNLEVLGRGGLPEADHVKLRADVIAQLEELTLLVSDLVDLAREEEPVAEREALRLDELVAAAVERARRHAPQVRFTTELEPAVVDGVRSRLDRAVANLLDNAAKYSDEVEVTLRDGELVVRDHGPGIADEDLPFVFDRFYRAPSARGRPGSGLGLAIVRQAAEAHGGSVHAATAPDGGAVLKLALSATS
jgi:two-component system sensor histidine kinase MprB